MKEPTEDLLLAYGRVAWGYNQVRIAQVSGKSGEPEYISIRDQLRKDRIDLEKLQRQYDDMPYQFK
jgi:hypothetical protein